MIEILDGITAFGRFRQWQTLQLNLKGERFAQGLTPQQAYTRITQIRSLPNIEGYRLELFRRAAVHAAGYPAHHAILMERLVDFSAAGHISKAQFDQLHRTVNRTVDAVRRKKGYEDPNLHQLR